MVAKRFSMVVVLGAVLYVSISFAQPTIQEPETPTPVTTNPDDTTDAFGPVDDMHHFMEYVCEPSYKDLQQLLASEPTSRPEWKSLKNHAMVLAESSALVADRGPEEASESKQWKSISLAVHRHGTSLYKSAGKYADAKKHFGLMVDQCNKCHTVFAEGKHQLKK